MSIHMTIHEPMQRNGEATCRVILERFFASYPNAAIQGRAAKALPLLAAAEKSLAEKPHRWAAGIVYAVGSRGVGVPGVLNRELEAAFGVKMNEVYRRAARVKVLLGDDLPSPWDCTSEEFSIRDEANTICSYAFRNGLIEDIHADGRISDTEMRQLMIQASRSLARLLVRKQESPAEYERFIRDYHRKYCRLWER